MSNELKKSFLCQTCRFSAPNAETLRDHCRSDYHDFNCKLVNSCLSDAKGCDMIHGSIDLKNNGPLSEEEYKEFIDKRDAIEKRQIEDSQEVFCIYCQKYSRNRNAYENHIKTKLHQNNIKSSQNSDIDQNEEYYASNNNNFKEQTNNNKNNYDNDDQSQDFFITECTCLFCNLESESMDKNFDHMKLVHGFMVVSPEYLVDRSGFYLFLASMIFGQSTCPSCNIDFVNPQKLQRHIRQKNHFNLNIHNPANLGYIDYYRFPENDEMFLYRSRFDQIQSDGTVVLPNGHLIYSKDASRQIKSFTKLEQFRQQQQLPTLNHYHNQNQFLNNHNNHEIEKICVNDPNAIVSYYKKSNSYYRMISSYKDHMKSFMKNKLSKKAHIVYTFRLNIYKP